jgi:hypothetical protein
MKAATILAFVGFVIYLINDIINLCVFPAWIYILRVIGDALLALFFLYLYKRQ